MANAKQTGNFIITLLLVIISIASIVGLYWLSTIVFTAQFDGDKTYTITSFSQTRMRLAQLAVVLIWFQICLTFVGALWSAAHFK